MVVDGALIVEGGSREVGGGLWGLPWGGKGCFNNHSNPYPGYLYNQNEDQLSSAIISVLSSALSSAPKLN